MPISVNPFLLPDEIRVRIPQANANLEHYRSAVASGVSTHRWMQDFFARPAVVFLIFPDDQEPGGLGMTVAKGLPAMRRSLQAGVPLIASAAAINVGCRAEAMAMAQLYGDEPKPKWLSKAEERRARKGARRRGYSS